MFHQYAYTAQYRLSLSSPCKVLGPPSEKYVSGHRPEEIIKILKEAGMNEDSFLVDWSMNSFDWHALKKTHR